MLPEPSRTIRYMDNAVLDVRSSALLRLALGINRFDPWNFYDGDSGYRHSADAHAEIDALIEARLASITDEEVEKGLAEHDHWLRDWVPDRLEAACTRRARRRVCAFTELHLLVDESLNALDEVVLEPARPSDPVFDGLPDLAASLSRDGLLPITVENIRQGHIGTNAAFWIGSVGLLPHPHLLPTASCCTCSPNWRQTGADGVGRDQPVYQTSAR